MRNTWRSVGVIALLSLLCLGAAVVTLRAAPQAADPAPARPAAPEESATIKDDPTIAPDPKQSADNNVSFPVDI